MRQYIDIDIYGQCEKLFPDTKKDPCKEPKSESENCNNKLYDEYKFYLAFENSLCDEYVTEKYWKLYSFDRFFKMNVVPVVRGPKPAHYAKISIKKSYINADDFKTARALADYLNYLDKNDTAYLEYFEWKLDYYKSFSQSYANNLTHTIETNFYEPTTDPFCDVCAKLHDKAYLNRENTPIKISQHFNPSTDCFDKPESPWLDRLVRFFGYCI